MPTWPSRLSRRRTLTAAVAMFAAALIAPAAAATAAAPTPGGHSAARGTADPVSLVNEFIGTENAGLDFPSTGAPFGMVQQTPVVQTRAGTKSRADGCYPDPANEIEGFSQSSINGCRFNYVPLMPVTGAITSTDPAHYASAFSRADEQVHPDYSRIRLTRYREQVELTATTRTGWQRYTFPRTRQAHVLFNTGAGVSKSAIHIVGDRTVEGWVDDFHKTYFVARLSRPFTGFGTWNGSRLRPGSRSSAHATSNGGWISFDTRHDDAPVVVKLALSYTGIAGARENLAAETKHVGFDFDAVHAALHRRWNATLGRVAVTGGSHARQVAFYTALYHASLDPNVIGDADGRYMGFDGRVHRATTFTPYSNLSLWDTYRTENELLEMLDPRVAHDVDMSILAIGRQGGWLPRWYLADQEDNIMTGDPITPYLVEAWSKGMLSGRAAAQAYAEVRRNATEVPPADVPENGRAGAGYFDRLGYIPYGLHVTTAGRCPSEGAGASCCPTHGNDNDCYYPGSAPLEYAAADGSLALMAKGLGHAHDARMFARLGQSYRNLFDRAIGLFRPRTLNGQWLAPYDHATGDHAFHEGDPAQYQWLVPQDPSGLVTMLGGRAATTKRLDRFFSYRHLRADPAGTARHSWVTGPYDYYGPATYDPDNEPNLVAPYLYAWTGHPGRTATVVRAAETLFTDRPSGITGNDDMGEMSAWYVMSAIGLYPTMSGANYYVVTTPEFPHTVVRIGTWKHRQGGTLNISAPGASLRDRYITSATVNGRAWQRDWIGQTRIAHGATIDYALSRSPTGWATGRHDAPPSVDTSPDREHRLSAAASPARAVVEPSSTGSSAQRVTLSLMVTAPGATRVRVSVSPPAGWTASASTLTRRVRSDGFPTQVKLPLTVTAPAGTSPGAYRVSTVARMSGAAATKTTTSLVVAAPGGCAIATTDSCAVDLSTAYNHDGVATLADPHQGDFDDQGTSYAANLLPAPGPVTLGGVTFLAPPTAGAARNFVRADGQTITLPAGRYRSIDVIGAASNGSTGSLGDTAVVTYADGSTAAVALRFTDWTKPHPGAGDAMGLHMRYAITGAKPHKGSPVSLFRTTLALDPSKTVRAVSLPAPAVGLWGAPGLTGLAWAHDSELEIYAMTLQR